MEGIEGFNALIVAIKNQIEEIDGTLAPLRDEDPGVNTAIARLKAFAEDIQVLKNLVAQSENSGEALLDHLQRL